MAILTSCENLIGTSDTFLDKLIEAENSLAIPYAEFQNSMKSYVNQFLSGENINFDSIMTQIDTSVSNQVQDVVDTVKGYSGDCLNSILGPIQGMLDDSSGFGRSIIGDVSSTLGGISGVITSSMSQFLDISGLFSALGITSIVGTLDNLFGCLTSAKCLPTGEIQSKMDAVTSFLKKYGLKDTGSFDLKDWLNSKIDILVNLPSKLVDTIQNGLQNLSSQFSTFFTNLQDKLSSIVDSFKNFSTSSITGVLSNLGAVGGLVGGIVSTVGNLLGGGGGNAEPFKRGENAVWDIVSSTKAAAARNTRSYSTK